MSLFVLPKQAPVSSGETYAGAKLAFFLTGTTTDADTYTDSARTTLHSNPVVASSGGVFEPIWLDPTVVYRVQLTTSADVLLYDIDPFPGTVLEKPYVKITDGIAAPATASGYALIYVDTADGDLKVKFGDGEVARLAIDSTNEYLRVSDGLTAPATEAGYALVYVDTADGDLKIKFGDGAVALLSRDAADTGSYTGTLTGCDTSPTGTIEYSIRGDVVTLEIPAVSGTSNTTAATITGMPAAIRPAAAQSVVGITTDNGTTVFGKLIVETSGIITLHVAQSATFTGSGTKGIAACTVTYRTA